MNGMGVGRNKSHTIGDAGWRRNPVLFPEM